MHQRNYALSGSKLPRKEFPIKADTLPKLKSRIGYGKLVRYRSGRHTGSKSSSGLPVNSK